MTSGKQKNRNKLLIIARESKIKITRKAATLILVIGAIDSIYTSIVPYAYTYVKTIGGNLIMKTELINYIENEFQATYYDISTLNFSNNMEALEYIKRTIKSLSMPVIFFIKPDLSASMRSMSLEDTCYMIFMKSIPESSRSLTEIAHEFGHFYYVEKGYPQTRLSSGEYIDVVMATILSNTVMDPMINRGLFNEGIDIVEYMRDAVVVQAPNLMFGYPEYNKMDKYQKHFVKCLLIEKIQEWEIIKNAIPNTFVEIAEKKYKRILVESRNFAKKINATGTDTPEKCKKLLKMLVEENNMRDEILII